MTDREILSAFFRNFEAAMEEALKDAPAFFEAALHGESPDVAATIAEWQRQAEKLGEIPILGPMLFQMASVAALRTVRQLCQ